MPHSFVASTTASLIALSLALACNADPGAPADPQPIGPVASNADQAFPGRPQGLAPLTRLDASAACVRAGECAIGTPLDDGTGRTVDASTAVGLVDLCIADLQFSTERAIPLTGFNNANERSEFWVACVISAGTDCAAIERCRTERLETSCQEDGCLGPDGANVVCDGDVATIVLRNGNRITRDCSRAYARCDTRSSTGCTDRPYTQCDPEQGRADRCDGDVRLGCDGQDQVSYRDCSRFGGTCGALPDGKQGCSYPGIDDDCAPGKLRAALCVDGAVSHCVNGGLVATPNATLCPSP
jgi:hypothetical protein